MQVFVGGAFNGKRAYVRQLVSDRDVQWIECSDVDHLPEAKCETIVVAGVEEFVERHLEKAEDEVIEEIMLTLNTYRKQSKVIVIVTEIGRGIVPIAAETRELRDRCGRLSQQICKEASEVTRIWYGLTERLK
ncbi:bifunctional adenosylcobinamide kinase/adenosylcobinamide-phosphate guanylyltransferase [Paenisporosarcina sp. TG20]|uniref:bifunctional adenosylcobinamide kinase/adenosylcobinamide-phosphate guanylyltransferase n=1 Tax=Paenisporosarcina sp. TG20 TaxID=1211706 RepID=UPI0002E4DF68|nr:bifunctional adenosylcobinamide kinase/adenosylcobinamide-phosphate guanylyltransferase [Paenisporosarcina sp. TG20]